MIELIELIVRLFLGIQQRRTPVTGNAPRARVANRPAAVTRKPPVLKKAPGRGRTPVATAIAIAQPIMTGTPQAAIASTGTAHAIPASSIGASAAKLNNKPSATAVTLRKWMTPATLRQQFMLTEIFQPPLALRMTTHQDHGENAEAPTPCRT